MLKNFAARPGSAQREEGTSRIGVGAEAICKRIRHTVKPFVVGTVAQALCAVAVVPERGESGLKAVAERSHFGDLESQNVSRARRLSGSRNLSRGVDYP